MTEGFQNEYGIPVSYISSGSAASGARVRAERAAGKYLLDVFVSGSDTPTMTFLPQRLARQDRAGADRTRRRSTKRKWKDGHLWYDDPQHMILRVLQYVAPELAVNTKLVKRGEMPTWKSLLDPKWQGKLRRQGSGQLPAPAHR